MRKPGFVQTIGILGAAVASACLTGVVFAALDTPVHGTSRTVTFASAEP